MYGHWTALQDPADRRIDNPRAIALARSFIYSQTMSKRFRVVGINFDHFHMGDLLRMVFDHPDAEIAGISDEQPERLVDAKRNFGLGDDRVFTDYRKCLERTKPDLAI